MMEKVEHFARETAFDLTHVDSIHLLRYAALIPGKTIYNWHNIESEAMRRYRFTVRSPERRWYARVTAGKLQAVERKILSRAFGHIVCSERERCELHRIVPAARIATVENGVDCPYFAGLSFTDSSATNRNTLAFVALFENVANALAATTFARRIWPGIRQRFPELRLVLVGARPLESVRALANIPGIEVTGTVPDVRPYYRDALAAIVPLLSGSGTRLKILEAMGREFR